MRTRPMPPFGLEVSEFQVSSAEANSVDELTRLISAHGVVVFREQDADDAQFVRFLKMLGDLTYTEGEIPVEGAPDLNLVSNVGRSTPPRSVFHTDTSYVERPPAFTALRAVTLPLAGGDTEFSDQVDAAEKIPERFLKALMGRRVRHSFRNGRSQATVWHPLFRRHPVTGKVALFLSTPERCTAMSGVDDQVGMRAIGALYRYSTRPTRVYRHAWRAGDIVIWDDRTTMHRADHHGVTGDRVLHRGMVKGEVPIPA